MIDRYKPELLKLVTQVRPAIDDGQFRMYLQPKIRLSDGRVAGAEALIRWEHPTLGRLSPADFIPMVEKTVLLQPLTHWAIEDVVRTLRVVGRLRRPAPGRRQPLPAERSSTRIFPRLVGGLLERVRRAAVAPATRADRELPRRRLRSLRRGPERARPRLGVGLSIDDFGTGFSSLSYLKRLPIEELKIDRSFVSHMLDRVEDFTIVRATVELGRNLGLRVVAEGVQDRDTFDRLGDFGCDEAQGFYIAKPLEPEAFWTLAVRTRSGVPRRRRARARAATGPATSGRAAESSAPSRISPGCPVATATGAVRVVVRAFLGGGGMSLRDVLDALVGSAPFERLLLERARPIVAKVDAGQDAVLAGVAVALDAPLLVVTPGPTRSRGPRPRDRCLPRSGSRRPPPGVGRVAVRGDGSGTRDRGQEGRRGRSPPVRRRSVRRRGAVPRRDAGIPAERWAPSLRCSWPRASSWRPTRSRSVSPSSATSGSTWSSIVASSPSEEASSTYSPASPGGPRASSTGVMRSSVSASSPRRRSCPRSSSAGSRSRRCGSSSPTTTSARSRRRAPPTSRPVPGRAAAPGRRAALRGSRHARALPVRSSAHPGGAPARRQLDRRDPRAAHVPTRGADARRGGGARRGDRMAGAEGALADR